MTTLPVYYSEPNCGALCNTFPCIYSDNDNPPIAGLIYTFCRQDGVIFNHSAVRLLDLDLSWGK